MASLPEYLQLDTLGDDGARLSLAAGGLLEYLINQPITSVGMHLRSHSATGLQQSVSLDIRFQPRFEPKQLGQNHT